MISLRALAPRRHRGSADLEGRISDAVYPQRLDRRTRRRPPLHFQRLELKYFLPERLLRRLLEALAPFTQTDPYLVQEGRGRTSYPVTSLYFDSYDLQSFDEKESGMLFRRKIRLRTYEEEFSESAPCFLEIKRRLDAVVFKDRLSLPAGVLGPSVPMAGLLRYLLAHAREANGTLHEAEMMGGWLNLQSTAVVRYQRLALVGRDDPNTRVTVDIDLGGLWRPAFLLGPMMLRSIGNVIASGCDGVSGRYGMLELKCNRTVPGWFHRAVQQMELMRTAYSKYFLVVSALRPRTPEDCHYRYQNRGGFWCNP